jgi:aspartyl-tRNA(Asn)/glutamyl-tRNA(Gln) amidotransferase subunit A
MYEKTRHDGFGEEVRKRIMVGNYVLSTGHADQYYDNARKVQCIIRKEFLDAFAQFDLLIMPTHPAPAFTFGAFDVDKLQMDLQDYFTCAVNLAGLPALSIPCGMSSQGLPIGVQLIGPHLSEDLILAAAHAHEQETDWHTKYPQAFI